MLLSRIEKSSLLDDDVRHLLRKLLEPHPVDRPASAAKVKKWFELLAEE